MNLQCCVFILVSFASHRCCPEPQETFLAFHLVAGIFICNSINAGTHVCTSLCAHFLKKAQHIIKLERLAPFCGSLCHSHVKTRYAITRKSGVFKDDCRKGKRSGPEIFMLQGVKKREQTIDPLYFYAGTSVFISRGFCGKES